MMEPVNKDVKEAVLGADKFLSVTLTQENLSPSTEKERSLLAEKFKNLITQLGLQSELPARGCKAPPRPPKGGISIPAPVTNGAGQEGEELYDDIAGVIPDDQYYSPMGPGGEEKSSNTDAGGDNYEIMSGDTEPVNTAPHGDAMVEEYVAMEDDNAQGGQEDYEEPGQQAEQKQQDSAPLEEEYEMPGTDPDYEETENPPADDTCMYEGVEPADDNLTTGEGSVDGAPNRERTVTVNMENLMKDTKPENIEGVILQGFLHKHRKEGKVYIGTKYQKRFCVVRNHMLYYFKDKKSPKQQGCILLPGYQVTTANKKGREFTLSHPEGLRSFQFEATSKKEADKWITALQSAANAPLSMRNSVNLDELRNKQPSGDEDSLHYDDLEQSNTSTTEVQQEANGDTNDNLYEFVGSVQLSTLSQPSNPQLAEYEITGASTTSPKPATEPSPAKPVIGEDYELPGQSPAPALPPPRPVKSVTQPPQDEVPPVVPPPRPSKASPPSPKSPAPTPPIRDDTYEIADTPEDTKPPPPPPSGEIELEDYEPLDTFQEPLPPPPMPAPVPPGGPVRPPKRKVSPPSGAGQGKSQENVPEQPGVKPTPPVPARQDETPPNLAEEKTSYINYANVYQALWDCTADEKEELGFRRGDLIYIYEKPHADWWIGSLFKPQGYSVGLVPKDYVMEAYEFTAAQFLTVSVDVRAIFVRK